MVAGESLDSIAGLAPPAATAPPVAPAHQHAHAGATAAPGPEAAPGPAAEQEPPRAPTQHELDAAAYWGMPLEERQARERLRQQAGNPDSAEAQLANVLPGQGRTRASRKRTRSD